MRGEYRNVIDEKGRIMIPPKLREELKKSPVLYLTKSVSHSLWLFTEEDFEELDKKVNRDPLSMFDRDSRKIDMAIISPARSVELDKVGRLAVPQVFREFAGLGERTDCVILGSRNHLEIIRADLYDSMIENFQDELEQSGDILAKMRT